MLLRGEESKRDEIVYNIDMVDPAYFGQAAVRSVDTEAFLSWSTLTSQCLEHTDARGVSMFETITSECN